MSKLINAFALTTALTLPTAAGATVISSSSLSSGPIEVTFSSDVSDTSGQLFSTASASLGPDGIVTSDNDPLPGVADAPPAVDGTMTADSVFTVGPDEISFASEASGSVDGVGEFGNAIGEVTGSFEFFNPTEGLAITIVMELTRIFGLTTDFNGELASAATSLSLALLNTDPFLPLLTLSNPGCDPNAAFSVANGADYSNSCSTLATFVFEDLPEGFYTLTFASNSSVDVVSNVPVPAAFGLFGLGLAGLGWKAKGRRKAS
jgi:hypothetical protein